MYSPLFSFLNLPKWSNWLIPYFFFIPCCFPPLSPLHKMPTSLLQDFMQTNLIQCSTPVTSCSPYCAHHTFGTWQVCLCAVARAGSFLTFPCNSARPIAIISWFHYCDHCIWVGVPSILQMSKLRLREAQDHSWEVADVEVEQLSDSKPTLLPSQCTPPVLSPIADCIGFSLFCFCEHVASLSLWLGFPLLLDMGAALMRSEENGRSVTCQSGQKNEVAQQVS